jgi:hypothetical protein
MQISRVSMLMLSAMLFLAMLGAGSLNAAPVVIDFEQFDGMPFENPTLVPESARLYDQLLATQGVLFTSGSPYVTVVNMGAGHAVSGQNAIAGSTPDGMLTYDRAYPVAISFFEPGNASVKVTTNFVSVRGDLWGSDRTVSLNAYDVNGNLIDAVTTNDVDGPTLEIFANGIHSVQLLGTDNQSGVAWDDLTFNRTSDQVCPVPAPASAMLVLCGLGAMRAFRRLRK